MEREQIAALLEKYWQAETTVEEEKILADYFAGPDVPSEWESVREVFGYYDREREVMPSEDLEERIMEGIKPRRQLRAAWWAAAAVIVVLMGVEPLLRVKTLPAGRETVAGSGRVARSGTVTAQLTVKDTYDDPEQALAAVRKALLVASRNMNKGLHPLK